MHTRSAVFALALPLLSCVPAFAQSVSDSDNRGLWGRAASLIGSAKSLFTGKAKKYKVLLDPGHTPAAWGTVSSQGLKERDYNQRTAAELLASLKADGDVDARLTNGPDDTVENTERPKLANKLGVDLFLSIHHDSVQDMYLSTWTFDGKQQVYCDKYHGFSLHVATDRPNSDKGLAFAKLVASKLIAAGFTPTLHHAENVPGERMKLLDKALGIYERNLLTVLKGNDRPAALLECGVLVNREEEKRLQDPQVRARLVDAVHQAIREFLKK